MRANIGNIMVEVGQQCVWSLNGCVHNFGQLWSEVVDWNESTGRDMSGNAAITYQWRRKLILLSRVKIVISSSFCLCGYVMLSWLSSLMHVLFATSFVTVPCGKFEILKLCWTILQRVNVSNIEKDFTPSDWSQLGQEIIQTRFKLWFSNRKSCWHSASAVLKGVARNELSII